jgi:hypothetical protein
MCVPSRAFCEKLLLHSWLLDLGVMAAELAIRFQGMAGERLRGCPWWLVVPYDRMRGDALPPPNRRQLYEDRCALKKLDGPCWRGIGCIDPSSRRRRPRRRAVN